jgi:hypothetical protein
VQNYGRSWPDILNLLTAVLSLITALLAHVGEVLPVIGALTAQAIGVLFVGAVVSFLSLAATRLGKIRWVVSVRVSISVTVALAGIWGIITYGNPPDESKYGFEIGDEIEWAVEDNPEVDCLGAKSLAQSSWHAKFGRRSLEVAMDLDNEREKEGKGEVYVDIDQQSLEDKAIQAWVMVPDERAVGDPESHNGFQLFVKDKDWNYAYGPWKDITKTNVGEWIHITLTPRRPDPSGQDEKVAANFDPAKIVRVGVKFAIGAMSKAKYKGPIYIDAVDW